MFSFSLYNGCNFSNFIPKLGVTIRTNKLYNHGRSYSHNLHHDNHHKSKSSINSWSLSFQIFRQSQSTTPHLSLIVNMAQVASLSAEMETLNHVLSLVEAFRAFDADNDGRITKAELGGILGSLGYNASEQEVGAMMQEGDKNRDGFLSIQEFLEMNTRELEGGSLGSTLSTAFEALDEDGNEILTGEDLHGVMQNLGLDLSLDNCVHLVASLDADGDGAVSLDEFRLIVDSLL